ncbi:MAG: SWIM zinc finger family protein [Methanospirillaceae archaeon]|nr:SWIM zinc finger family protein [Methanospirillaceae archaeon]
MSIWYLTNTFEEQSRIVIYYAVVSARDHLTSKCSCPVGKDCKHGVALILAYLKEIKRGITVPEPPTEEYFRRYQPLLS